MKKKIRFIINPKSGATHKEHFEEWIRAGMDTSRYEFDICHTRARYHATELSREAAQTGFDIVVAVGGDGSVNEVGAGILGTSAAVGIIPAGSGNGLARHLGIPMKFQEAVQILNRGNNERIDTLRINEHFCAGTFGVGFDAHVAHLFAASSRRGYSTYVKLVLTEFYKYQSPTFRFELDGKKIERECFLLTFANSSQFGNNAVIAPFAHVKDGIIDVSVMRQFPLFVAPSLIYRLMHNSLQRSRYFEGFKGRSIVLKNDHLLKAHIDGEPVEFSSDIRIEMVPLSLNIIVP